MFLQALVDGISLGGIYATCAMGLSLAFGVMGMVNWAHGEFIMLSMFLSYILVTKISIDPYLTLFINAAVFFVIGYMLQKFLFNNILKKEIDREPLSVLISTAGLSMVLFSIATMIFGSNAMTAPTKYMGKTIWLGDVMFSVPRTISFVIAIITTIALYLFIQKSELGRSLRATSQDRNVAKLMGINTDKAYCIAFGIALALVGIAAALLIPNYSVYPKVGAIYSFKCFVIVVLGGKGNIRGCLAGGIIIGIIERLGAILWTESYAQVLVFALFILMLIIKPNGLFSKSK